MSVQVPELKQVHKGYLWYAPMTTWARSLVLLRKDQSLRLTLVLKETFSYLMSRQN